VAGRYSAVEMNCRLSMFGVITTGLAGAGGGEQVEFGGDLGDAVRHHQVERADLEVSRFQSACGRWP
jgi:hypothetical protein